MQEVLPSSGKVHDLAAAAGSSDLLTSDEFRMYAYKILPCPKRSNHEWTTCPYAHPAEKARRRDPRIYNYLAIPCEATKQGGTCPRGDECPNCHSLFEYWLHPSRYRTQLCRDMENGYCRRQVCFFAHSVEELRVPDYSHLHIPPEMQPATCDRGYSSCSTTSTSQESTDTTGTTGEDTSNTSALQTFTKEGSGDHKIAVVSEAAHYQPGNRSSAAGQAVRRARKHRGCGKALDARDATMLRAPGSAQPWLAGGNHAFNAMHSQGDIRSEDGCSGPWAAFNLPRQNSMDQVQVSAAQLLSQGLSSAGSSYKRQLEALVAAEQLAQLQYVQQQLTMQQTSRQPSLWSAPSLPCSSLADYTPVEVGSPNMSHVQDTPVSCTSNSSTLLAACSTSRSAASLLPAAASDWQHTVLLRTLSTPPAASLASALERHGPSLVSPSPGSAQLASWGNTMQQRQLSFGPSVSADQDMTLATFLGCSMPDTKWPPAASLDPDTPLGCDGTSGLLMPPLSCGQLQEPQPYTANAGMMLGREADLSSANLLLLQQEQQQEVLQGQQMVAQTLDMLQAACGYGVADASPHAANDVLGALMQQLMLQQCS